MIRKKSLIILIIFLSVSLFTVNTMASQTLFIAKDQEAVGFDPHKVPALSSLQIYRHLYNRLVDMDEGGHIVPELAYSWTITDDTIYTFQLREGVKFHNGREMTSHDVKYSFSRILDPATASIAQSYFNMIKEIHTPDDYTVVFQLENPFADFLINLSNVWAAIVPHEVVSQHGDLNQVTCGTGPFMLKEWIPDNYTLLVKNPYYFEEGLPKVDAMKFLIMKDESARIAALRSGTVHISSITSDAAIILANQRNLSIISYPSLDYTYLGFNTTKEPFNNPLVRLAFSYAIDRELLADIVYGGEAAVTGPLSPSQKAWAVDVDLFPSYSVDRDRAKELLKEAGYGEGLSFTIKTASTYPYMIDTAISIQNQLSLIGVISNIELVEWGAYVNAWRTKDHETLVGLNGSGVTPDRALHFFFHTNGTANVWGFSSSKFDALVEKARVTPNEGERYEIYGKAQKILVNEYSPNLFLNSPYRFYAVNNDVIDFNPSSLAGESILKKVSIK